MKAPLLRRLLVPLLALSAMSVRAAPVTVKSPDQRWAVSVSDSGPLALRVTDGSGQPLLQQEIALALADGRKLDQGSQATVSTRTVDETVTPTVALKSAKLRDHFNEAVLDFGSGFSLVVRAYDDGVAYRFATKFDGQITVAGEKSVTTFPGDPTIYYGEETTFHSHNEILYTPQPLSQLKPEALTSLPLLVRLANGTSLLFSETALESYPGQWMRVGPGSRWLEAIWPALPTREEEISDRDLVVRERDANIAITAGTRAFPWRFVALAEKDAELLTNSLSYLLADPSRVADTSWIKPGKVQWDWWHNFNVWDTDFVGGVSQKLYLHYIDFAAQNGLPYVILDEGWYKLGDLTAQAEDIDVPALVKYGKSKGVGVILWSTSTTLQKQFDVAMEQFTRWGIAGLKVDFFQRDDQPAIDFYWKLSAEGAKRKLLLDYHGAHKPAGLQRTYPNVLTFEGVRGLENAKWSDWITPEHDTTLPFIRQVAGPMDYTPGAMDNAQKEQFHVNNRRPMSQGTRAHQLALYVVYESPLQMLADSPSAYRAAPDAMKFLREVPVTWDETRVLEAEIGVKVAVARRSGKRWFIAALNNSEARTLELDLSFLPAKVKSLEVWQDGPNAARDGRDSQLRTLKLDSSRRVKVELAPGGGWVGVSKK